jgi:hypothetical protein
LFPYSAGVKENRKILLCKRSDGDSEKKPTQGRMSAMAGRLALAQNKKDFHVSHLRRSTFYLQAFPALTGWAKF